MRTLIAAPIAFFLLNAPQAAWAQAGCGSVDRILARLESGGGGQPRASVPPHMDPAATNDLAQRWFRINWRNGNFSESRYISLSYNGERSASAEVISGEAGGSIRVRMYNRATQQHELVTLTPDQLETAATSDAARRYLTQVHPAPTATADRGRRGDPGARALPGVRRIGPTTRGSSSDGERAPPRPAPASGSAREEFRTANYQDVRDLQSGRVVSPNGRADAFISSKSLHVEGRGDDAIEMRFSLADREHALANGDLFDNVRPSELPRVDVNGQPARYTFVVTEDGSTSFGRYGNPAEFGTRHINVANGRRTALAGEIEFLPDGSMAYNLESGSFMRDLVGRRGPPMDRARAVAQRIFERDIPSVRYVDPTERPIFQYRDLTRAEIEALCRSPLFRRLNGSAFCH